MTKRMSVKKFYADWCSISRKKKFESIKSASKALQFFERGFWAKWKNVAGLCPVRGTSSLQIKEEGYAESEGLHTWSEQADLYNTQIFTYELLEKCNCNC